MSTSVTDERVLEGAIRVVDPTPHYGPAVAADRPSALQEALTSPLLRRALIAAVVIEHVLFVIAPLDVLFPVVAHDIGQQLVHGHLPYRDFAFEYPPLASAMFVLPGLVPDGLAQPMLALQAVALEAAVFFVVIKPRGTEVVWRWVIASVLIFPFLSGGFDALPMAAIAISTVLLANERASGWWVAAAGTAAKLSPAAVWAWARRPLVPALVAGAVTAAVLLGSLALADSADDGWLGYNAHRGVQVESSAGVTTWVTGQVSGSDATFEYRFRSWQVGDADAAANLWLAVAALGVVVLLVRCGRHGPNDPWVASLAATCVLLVGLKVFSPQYVAWATPLAVVLGGRWWRLWLGVLGLTVLAYAIGGHGAGFFLAVAARNVLVLVVAVTALRAIRPRPRPAPQPVAP